jgi:hypothetical protein
MAVVPRRRSGAVGRSPRMGGEKLNVAGPAAPSCTAMMRVGSVVGWLSCSADTWVRSAAQLLDARSDRRKIVCGPGAGHVSSGSS